MSQKTIPFTTDLPRAFQEVQAHCVKQSGMPDILVRGGPMDAGVRVPDKALTDESAFVAWATDAGFARGLAVEVEEVEAVA
jgi:hypothetical protein